ncbi:hypothetical protein HYW21_08440 [Candidatus Woesearchaeota archaeon]|nr:hypothetical protein [Candidatus Woesearchaeota archaeon]
MVYTQHPSTLQKESKITTIKGIWFIAVGILVLVISLFLKMRLFTILAFGFIFFGAFKWWREKEDQEIERIRRSDPDLRERDLRMQQPQRVHHEHQQQLRPQPTTPSPENHHQVHHGQQLRYTTKYCPRCKATLEGRDHYCFNCGMRV